MAETLLEILQQLRGRQHELLTAMRSLEERNQELNAENLDLRGKIEEAEKKREEALLEVEYLKVSHRLAESPDTIVETRRMIAGLIRNIDRCIEMLKE